MTGRANLRHLAAAAAFLVLATVTPGLGVSFASAARCPSVGAPLAARTHVVAADEPTATAIDIRTTASTAHIGNKPTLAGNVGPNYVDWQPLLGKNMVVYVRKPGKSYFSYSSARTIYLESTLGAAAAWQYKCAFKWGMAKGVYRIKAVLPAYPGFVTSHSAIIGVKLK